MDFAELIDESAEQAGLDPAALTSRHLQSIQRSLDLLFIELESQGANAEYRQLTVELPAPAGTSVVLLPADCIDVTVVSVRNAATAGNYLDTSLSRISRDTWAAMPNRNSMQGHPSSYWLSKTLPQDTVILQGAAGATSSGWGASGWAFGGWGGASAAASVAAAADITRRCLVLWPGCATDMTLTINYVRRMTSPLGLAGNIDADHFWLPTLAVGLASKIAQKFNMPRYAGLVAEYSGKLNSRVADEDMHPVVVGFRGHGWSRRRRH